jgi:hypothetical protein
VDVAPTHKFSQQGTQPSSDVKPYINHTLHPNGMSTPSKHGGGLATGGLTFPKPTAWLRSRTSTEELSLEYPETRPGSAALPFDRPTKDDQLTRSKPLPSTSSSSSNLPSTFVPSLPPARVHESSLVLF